MTSLAASVAAKIALMLEKGGLPPTLPDEPMTTLLAWFDDAAKSGKYDDPNAMTLATADAQGRPSARTVLCKSISAQPPIVKFYTNLESRKGRELAANPNAACLFFWPHCKRQARVEGNVTRLSDAENDEYYASRALLSRLGAWSSHQSQSLVSREKLVTDTIEVARKHNALTALLTGGDAKIPRPPHWGGFAIHVRAIELWVGSESGRLHDRARWTRTSPEDQPASWSRERLCP
ncbi:MAG: pyridoxamine 5'-phosphate oxidase [Phycisphaerales bacterium]|nr:pyridoxamine 5'-phosphate oxidase [Phycisphaerales bacterium]